MNLFWKFFVGEVAEILRGTRMRSSETKYECALFRTIDPIRVEF